MSAPSLFRESVSAWLDASSSPPRQPAALVLALAAQLDQYMKERYGLTPKNAGE